jgi:hypothetical protein
VGQRIRWQGNDGNLRTLPWAATQTVFTVGVLGIFGWFRIQNYPNGLENRWPLTAVAALCGGEPIGALGAESWNRVPATSVLIWLTSSPGPTPTLTQGAWTWSRSQW